MSVPTPEPQPLVIRGRAIRADENGLICLNDIWSAAGFTKHQRPFDWMRLYTTQARIERVEANYGKIPQLRKGRYPTGL